MIEKESTAMAIETGIVVIETENETERGIMDIEKGRGERETGTPPGGTTGAEILVAVVKGNSTITGEMTIDVPITDAMKIVAVIVVHAKKVHRPVADEVKKTPVPLKGDPLPQKDPFHCLSADARLRVGMFMLPDMNNIPPCRQNKQVSSIFPGLTVPRFHPFLVSQVYLPRFQSKRLEWASAATLTCLGSLVVFILAASHQRSTNRI